ncbi:hypothetical protein B0T10DRAFT_524414, partial [Thelonectria olida]
MGKPTEMGRSARWGAACNPCAIAKVRCHRSTGTPGTECDRCWSLAKKCTQQVPKPRKKRQAKPTKKSQLDDETIIESLKLQEQICPSLDGLLDSNSDQPLPPCDSSSPPTTQSPSEDQFDEDAVANTSMPGFNPFARRPCTCPVNLGKEDLGSVEPDEKLLSIYQNHLTPPFPFVIVSPGTAVAQLQRGQPFLMKVIRMVAHIRDRRLMWEYKQAIMQHISDAVILKSERSLDLLQGILVFLGYYNYYCLAHGQFNNLTHLAHSMIGDIGLDRDVRPRERNQYEAMDPKEPKARTNEERRALVGVWYMSSISALTFSKLDSPRYTKHFERCLSELKDAAEQESDELLVELVRIQHFTQEIFEFNDSDQVAYSCPGLIPHQISGPSHLYEAQAELERARSSLPQPLKSNYLLTSHYDIAQLRILEPQLSRADPRNDAITAALRAWFDNWLAIPTRYYSYMPMPGFGHLIYAVSFLARRARILLLAQDWARDNSANAQQVHPTPETTIPHDWSETTEGLMLGVLESLAVRFASAKDEMATIHGGDWNNDLLDLAARRLRVIKARIERWCQIVATDSHSPVSKDQIRNGLDEGQQKTVKTGNWWLEQLDGPWLDESGRGSWL